MPSNNSFAVTAETELLATMMRSAIENRRAAWSIFETYFPIGASKVSDFRDTLWVHASHEASLADVRIVRLILATDPNLDSNRVQAAEHYHCPPRAVVVDGVAYVASPDEGLDGITPDYREREEGSPNCMHLVIMPACNITDLGGVAPAEPRTHGRGNLPAVPFGIQSRS